MPTDTHIGKEQVRVDGGTLAAHGLGATEEHWWLSCMGANGERLAVVGLGADGGSL